MKKPQVIGNQRYSFVKKNSGGFFLQAPGNRLVKTPVKIMMQ